MTIDSATEIIYHWGSTADRKIFIFHGCRDEIAFYLQAVDEIQRMVDCAASKEERKHAESVIQIAMSRLLEEFHNILKDTVLDRTNTFNATDHNSYIDSTTMTDSATNNYEVYEDDYIKPHTLSAEAINDLRSIVMRMDSSGFVQECLKVYVNERKSFIDACLQHLKIEKLSRDSCRRLEWAVLKHQTEMWIEAATICFRYYLVNEKELCEQVFYGLGDKTIDSCFMDTITYHTNQLFDNAEALSCIRPAPERLFKILDLHDMLSDLIPSIHNLYNSQSLDLLRTRAINQIIPKLADKAKEIFQNFENTLVNENSPVVGYEPIHWLSRYVMNYVYKLCVHKQTLMRLVPCDKSFSLHVEWIIMRLVSNLEDKSKLCKDPVARRFFAMNNFHYIIREINAHQELQRCVADDNFMKLIDNFIKARSEFLNLTVNVVLKNLKDERLNKIKYCFFKVSNLTDRLRRFNNGFEKLKRDVGWLCVADHELLSELRELIVEMVVTEYTSFLLQTEKVPRNVKYSAEEIEYPKHQKLSL